MSPQALYPPEVERYGDPGKRLFDRRVASFIQEFGDTPEEARRWILLGWDGIVDAYGPRNLQREAQEHPRP